MPEPSPNDAMRQAQLEYAEAEKMPRSTQQEAKARMAAMRAAYDKIMALQGQDLDTQKRQKFTMSG
jgi:hypothetical protein